jgi:hypothetical protein
MSENVSLTESSQAYFVENSSILYILECGTKLKCVRRPRPIYFFLLVFESSPPPPHLLHLHHFPPALHTIVLSFKCLATSLHYIHVIALPTMSQHAAAHVPPALSIAKICDAQREFDASVRALNDFFVRKKRGSSGMLLTPTRSLHERGLVSQPAAGSAQLTVTPCAADCRLHLNHSCPAPPPRSLHRPCSPPPLRRLPQEVPRYPPLPLSFFTSPQDRPRRHGARLPSLCRSPRRRRRRHRQRDKRRAKYELSQPCLSLLPPTSQALQRRHAAAG